ncbi:MAG: succinate--CoA ligase subunit alpha [Armatimonadota bacterium]|nr:succinate--CoA ligase subunit alpha [Armatimonadota bacterium]
MSVIVDRNTRLLIAGITGREGKFHTSNMIRYGTRVVAGVVPGKGGFTTEENVPVYDTVAEAVHAQGANAACIFVPAKFDAADSILECITAGVELVVCLTDGIPIGDMVRVYRQLKSSHTRLIGPNCPGLITPGECNIGFIPGHMVQRGRIGMVSRSGTLTYETAATLSAEGMGQSTCIGIGGDPVIGTTFLDVLPLFEADPETDAVVMIGEIGGSDEENAAEFIKTMKKPVISFISGRTAPPGKRMGHAGAIVSGNTGTAQGKVDALTAAGAVIADTMEQIPEFVRRALA